MPPLPRLPAHWAGCLGPPPKCCGRGRVGVGAQRCLLGLHALLGAACRGGGGGLSPWEVACRCCEGRLVSGAVPPRSARPLGPAAGVLRRVCPGCCWCGRGDPAPAPQRAPLRAGVAPCQGGGRASPGGGAFHRCEGRLSSGAPPKWAARPLGGRLGSATYVLWAQVCGCRGPTLSPWPACPVGAACRGGGGGPSPGGVACHRCEGLLVSGAVPPPVARPLGGPWGSAIHMLWARLCGFGGPALSPWPACPVGAACRGGGGGPPPGGVACYRCEGRLVSDAVPPPTARPLGQVAGVPRPMCTRCGRCGRGDPAPAPQRAPLRAGVACRGGGGRASPGGCLLLF